MSTSGIDQTARQKPLRLWPGVAIVVLQWLAWLIAPIAVPEATMYGILGGLFGGLAIVVWWAFFSRAPRAERWGAILVMIAAIVATPRILHRSIATGMMGKMFFLYAVPVLSLAFVASPDQFTEVARFKAIEGKTWNHPVLVGDVLLVRNGEEMVAYRLSLAGARNPSS